MGAEDLLVCAVCHAELAGDPAGPVRCAGCGRTYTRREGILDLTPVPPPDEGLRSTWSLWEELQANGEASYRDEAEASLSVGEREDAARFAAFCRLSGIVLDVGCGPQSVPSYAGADRFVGIDPLRGQVVREFDFVQGIGEYLPFREGTFDHVLFATSLDHLLDPVRSLREAVRVLAPGGTIEIWSGEVPEPPAQGGRAGLVLAMLRRGQLRELARAVRGLVRQRSKPASRYHVPQGAADAFHLFHPTRARVDGIVAAAELATLEVHSPAGGQRFMRLVPDGD